MRRSAQRFVLVVAAVLFLALPSCGKKKTPPHDGQVTTDTLKVFLPDSIDGVDRSQRGTTPELPQSSETILMTDHVEIHLSVQPAKEMDESVKLIEELDLDGLAKLTK